MVLLASLILVATIILVRLIRSSISSGLLSLRRLATGMSEMSRYGVLHGVFQNKACAYVGTSAANSHWGNAWWARWILGAKDCLSLMNLVALFCTGPAARFDVYYKRNFTMKATKKMRDGVLGLGPKAHPCTICCMACWGLINRDLGSRQLASKEDFSLGSLSWLSSVWCQTRPGITHIIAKLQD